MELAVRDLHKSFGKVKAVDGVSFTLNSGLIYGFVGPNGAGKTTTMRMMATLDRPDSGDIQLDGTSLLEYPEEARHQLGFVPDALPKISGVTVWEYLDFFARAYKICQPQRQSIIAEIAEFTGVYAWIHRDLKGLSKGMRQRVTLARALIHNPNVLLLDEPAAGLDPSARLELRTLLKSLANQGKTILISSHILGELTEMCDGAVIVGQGKVLCAGTMQEMLNPNVLQTCVWIQALSKQGKLSEFLKTLPYVRSCKQNLEKLRVEIDGDQTVAAELLKTLIHQNYTILSFQPETRNLEHIFLEVTGAQT